MTLFRIAVLISGEGTILRNLIEESTAGHFTGLIAVVVPPFAPNGLENMKRLASTQPMEV